MKTCPACKTTYHDDETNFCLVDGATLIQKKGRSTDRSHWNDVLALLVAAIGLLILLSLMTASGEDRSIISTGMGNASTRNWIGPLGANIAAVCFSLVGWTAYLLAPLVFLVAWRVYASDTLLPRPSRVFGFIFFIVSLAGLTALFGGYGAIVGESAYRGIAYFISNVGAGILLTAIFIASLLLVTNFTIAGFMSHFEVAWENFRIHFDEWRNKGVDGEPSPSLSEAKLRAEKRREKRKLGDSIPPTIKVPEESIPIRPEPTINEGPSIPTLTSTATADEIAYETIKADPDDLLNDDEPPFDLGTSLPADLPPDVEERKADEQSDLSDTAEPVADQTDRQDYSHYKLPTSEMLTLPAPRIKQNDDELRAIAADLSKKTSEFNVGGTVMNISKGPVVTTYEFKPDAGVRYSRVTNLADDLCLALKAESIRIDRIPGKAYVGIEVPNSKREVIALREVIESSDFTSSKSLLTLALGKSIGGATYTNDLAKMPHLLIAGATGAGKSVGVNTLVMSILYKARPDEVKFIMVDPKRLELGLYADIPHLSVPIITEPKKAANALKWAVTEMERRYKDLAGYGVRNIAGYNDKITGYIAEGRLDDNGDPYKKLPYIVIIIDELADLMMVAGKEVEESITRLAQMARAVGIHLVLATQRPSVDVITGLIKANFPSRIAFRVSSKVDSRTIIDGNGAESLLGQGDMLFLPPGQSNVIRVHGAFVDEVEIKKVVDFIKEQGKPEYDQTITRPPDEDTGEGDLPGKTDPLFFEALKCVVQANKGSTSLLQRHLRIGYGRAAAILDAMVREGYIGEMDGSTRARPVLPKAFEDVSDLNEGAAGDL